MKSEIVNITEISHFDIKKKHKIKNDGSHTGLGATLEFQREQWKTIAFATRFLNNHEMIYYTNKRELVGVVWSSEQFRKYLFGAEFEIVTDH